MSKKRNPSQNNDRRNSNSSRVEKGGSNNYSSNKTQNSDRNSGYTKNTNNDQYSRNDSYSKSSNRNRNSGYQKGTNNDSNREYNDNSDYNSGLRKQTDRQDTYGRNDRNRYDKNTTREDDRDLRDDRDTYNDDLQEDNQDRNDGNLSKGGNDTPTDDDHRHSDYEDDPSVNPFDEEPHEDTEDDNIEYLSFTEDDVREARRRCYIPSDGFMVESRRGRLRRDIEERRLRRLEEKLREPRVLDHIRETVALFVDDTDSTSRQSRTQIDLPFILAVAIRESGVDLPLSTRNSRIVTAGRDAHTRGRSGLDWVYSYRNKFPSSIRSQVRRVEGNPDVPGEFRRECQPAFLRERDLLAAFIVEVRQRYTRFLRRFNRHEFSDSRGFTQEDRDILLRAMSADTKRAWIQASFGSKLSQLLQEVRGLIDRAKRDGRSISDIARDNQVGLNALIANDEIMPTNLSRQRTRISAAEAIITEHMFPSSI